MIYTSRKKAIRALCLMCMGGAPSEVKRCTSKECPLHPYRMGKNPFSKKSGQFKKREESPQP